MRRLARWLFLLCTAVSLVLCVVSALSCRASPRRGVTPVPGATVPTAVAPGAAAVDRVASATAPSFLSWPTEEEVDALFPEGFNKWMVVEDRFERASRGSFGRVGDDVLIREATLAAGGHPDAARLSPPVWMSPDETMVVVTRGTSQYIYVLRRQGHDWVVHRRYLTAIFELPPVRRPGGQTERWSPR